MSYDQWKTASPYDDEPDCIEEAEKWLKKFKLSADSNDPGVRHHYWMIQSLVEYIEENV